MSRFNYFENINKNLWEYGTNPEYEITGVTSTELKLQKYVEDNSAILKRGFWAKRHLGVVLVVFDTSLPKLIFIYKPTLAMKLPNNVATDALNFLNSNGRLHNYSDGLIVIGHSKLNNDYSIQDYPLHGRDVGLPYLVE